MESNTAFFAASILCALSGRATHETPEISPALGQVTVCYMPQEASVLNAFGGPRLRNFPSIKVLEAHLEELWYLDKEAVPSLT